MSSLIQSLLEKKNIKRSEIRSVLEEIKGNENNEKILITECNWKQDEYIVDKTILFKDKEKLFFYLEEYFKTEEYKFLIRENEDDGEIGEKFVLSREEYELMWEECIDTVGQYFYFGNRDKDSYLFPRSVRCIILQKSKMQKID